MGAIAVVLAGLAGCGSSGSDDVVPPLDLADPCALVTPERLDRLAPGAERLPQTSEGSRSASRSCSLDLTAAPRGQRGDLTVEVSADGEQFDDAWQRDRCEEIDAELGAAGPGDTSCFSVRPFDGSQARIDGYAWSERGYQVHVLYQLIDPEDRPATAEADLRTLLAEGVEALPAA